MLTTLKKSVQGPKSYPWFSNMQNKKKKPKATKQLGYTCRLEATFLYQSKRGEGGAGLPLVIPQRFSDNNVQ
jgi:hypothetical protein